jgi:hypothetical protein
MRNVTYPTVDLNSAQLFNDTSTPSSYVSLVYLVWPEEAHGAGYKLLH